MRCKNSKLIMTNEQKVIFEKAKKIIEEFNNDLPTAIINGKIDDSSLWVLDQMLNATIDKE